MDLALFGRRLRELRKRKGWTLAELARQTGLSIGYLGDLEHQRASPSVDTVVALALALGVTSDYLLGISDEESGSRVSPRTPPPRRNAVVEAARRAAEFLEDEARKLRALYGIETREPNDVDPDHWDREGP